MTDAKNTNCGSVSEAEQIREALGIPVDATTEVLLCALRNKDDQFRRAMATAKRRGDKLKELECRSVPRVWVNVSPYNPNKGKAYTSADAAMGAKRGETLETYGPFDVQDTEHRSITLKREDASAIRVLLSRLAAGIATSDPDSTRGAEVLAEELEHQLRATEQESVSQQGGRDV